jgi:isoquinoline 1-oxidoreductase beta subunit
MKRRTLLLSGAAIGGGLVVGWGVLPPRSRLGSRTLLSQSESGVALNGWLRIEPGGGVQLAMHKSEMGQGVHTALAMLVAEEMDIGLDRIRLFDAGSDAIYGNVAMFVGALPFHPRDREPGERTRTVRGSEWMVRKLVRELGITVTGASTSVADSWEPLRLAAAAARAQLVGAASLTWKLPKEEITVREGRVLHASGPQAHFGELARAAAATPAGDVTLKPRSAWTLIGRAVPRTDALAKSDGSAVFGLDVRPGDAEALLFAAVRMCPALGGAPQRITNEDDVLRRPGVLRMVRLGPIAGATAGVAIVARSTWHAQQAVDALAIDWQSPPAGVADSNAILAALEQQAREALDGDAGFAFHSRGDVAQAEAKARAQAGGSGDAGADAGAVSGGSGDGGGGGSARLIEAIYRAPYLAHATMEPMNCTAQVQSGRVTVWAPTQNPASARAVAARAAGVGEDAVTLHVTLLGGGFGRRLDVDFIGQAVTIAQFTGGRPVQLAWSREEDMTHDFYRPAAAAALRATLGPDGLPLSLRIASASDAITPRWLERGLPALAAPVETPDKTSAEGLFDQAYGIEHQRISHVATRSGVPVGYWRSVGHSHNAFFIESFIDELAHAAGRDPVAFRLALLAHSPRHAAVLRLAAGKAGWGSPLPADGAPEASPRARGVALHESFGSVVAQVVEASVTGGRPRVHRVVCAIDCGTVVNPGIVRQQMEGGIVFGLSAALHGRIDIVQGVVQQKNFPDYPLATLAGSPLIETHIVPSTLPPAGVGEPGTPPLAPALANALFALTGKRLRELPLRV